MKKMYIALVSILLTIACLGIESIGFFDFSYTPTHNYAMNVENSAQGKNYNFFANKQISPVVRSYVVDHEEPVEKQEGEPEHKKEKQNNEGIALFDPYQFLKDAVIKNDVSLVRSLTMQGKFVDLTDHTNGQNLLHVAPIHDAVDVFNLLLDQGLNLYLKDYSGYTPLDYAEKYHSLKIVQAIHDYIA